MHVQPLAFLTAIFEGQSFAEHQSGQSWSLVKMFIPLEPKKEFFEKVNLKKKSQQRTTKS